MKAVLDTNVIIASFLSASPESPGRQLLAHWSRGSFHFLYSRDTFLEYAEVLLRKKVPSDLIRAFLSELRLHGKQIVIHFFIFPCIPAILMTSPSSSAP
jgi:predicted nucleic acid-binding protein